jgi:hypothetical protein
MTMTGNGALEEADIALLRTVPVAFLHDDKHDRGVLYADRSRVKPKDRRSMVRTRHKTTDKICVCRPLGLFSSLLSLLLF